MEEEEIHRHRQTPPTLPESSNTTQRKKGREFLGKVSVPQRNPCRITLYPLFPGKMV